jgi:flagellar biosynthetic protein FliQ
MESRRGFAGEKFLLIMTTSAVVDLMRTLFVTAFWLSLPVLAAGFVVGIVMSLIQILTSIQDSSFSSVPRLTAFLGAMILAMPWMLAKLMTYTIALFGDLGRFAH